VSELVQKIKMIVSRLNDKAKSARWKSESDDPALASQLQALKAWHA
jgi:hypothetical protein